MPTSSREATLVDAAPDDAAVEAAAARRSRSRAEVEPDRRGRGRQRRPRSRSRRRPSWPTSSRSRPDVEPVAAEVETVAAEDEAGRARLEIAARLAAWSAAAVVMDAARDDEPAAKPSIAEKGAAQTGGLLRRFRAGQNLDAELDDYERQQAATPPVADELEPELVAERGPSPPSPRPSPSPRSSPRPWPSPRSSPRPSPWPPSRREAVEPEAERGRRARGRSAAEPSSSPSPSVAGRRARGRRGRAESRAEPEAWPPSPRSPREPAPPDRRRHRAADLADVRAGHDARCPAGPPRRVHAVDPGCRVRRGPERRAAVADPPRVAGRRIAGGRPAVPESTADADRAELEALWAASAREVVAPPTVPGRAGGRRRPAVRQLRAVTLRHRPVLPALRDSPGRLTRPGRADSSRTRTQAAP